MKAIIARQPGVVEVGEIPEPEITHDYMVKTKTLMCGLCGTDKHIISGVFHSQLLGGRFTSYPTVLGHESVGEVIEMGHKVRSFKIGDRILKPCLLRVSEGMSSMYGGFSEYTVAYDYTALVEDGIKDFDPVTLSSFMCHRPISPGMPTEHAVIIITLTEVFSAMNRIGLARNKSLLIYGAGPVGLTFTRFARLRGMNPIVVVDPSKRKLDLAKSAGADVTASPNVENAPARARQVVGAKGFDFIVDAAGSTGMIQEALGLIAFNGKICEYGIAPHAHVDLDWLKAQDNWTLQFIQWPNFEEQAAVLGEVTSLVESGAIDPMKVVEKILHVDHTDQAMHLAKGEDALKIIIKF
jgi:2-desacetyl-2-hydroxyethyl bacteriochlorophyllide A dehydrogenase